ncbi:hypothetical protein TWF569_000849 [Orbilia oligospora]|uniref:DUF1749-domain-containing protein n=1 Tax=Orbilia oligospora TaxID=2813651 RepID=A0A7C8J1I1_ORBOL|nr:hypothetical protein TWF103_003620 [Orbilia oligospora]KAF3082392.1 hypothetical protein TWF102_001232 [Orbilia oligospora]KAF3089911.1 hypothetical protein TWF706_010293 [Orbilia oligospora]KAF3125407.1 hypothetical protein TWF569_000849 [Orbilia oligospora]KAF3140447.1 hypothetical protein TWF594_006416 [Orbilia oligospora]
MDATEPRPTFVPTSYPGILHHYTKDLTAFEFDSPALRSSSSNGNGGGKPNTLLFIAGLGDNLLTVPYVSDLVKTGWSVVQVLISSTANGWGTGTLTRDAKEIALCISYFKIQLSRPKVVVLGHSTGCQDIMHYLCRLEVSQQAHGQLDGAILQAPVSDREALAMMMGKETYERSWKHAQRLVKSGRGGDIMPAQITKEVFEAPCSAFRWYSLTSPNMDGEDDFFSSDIGEDILEGTFGAVVPAGTPLLVCYSGEDEFVPLTVDKEGLVEKWVRVCVRKGVNVDVKNSGVVKKATHNFAGCEGEVFEDFLGRVRRFLKVVEAGGKFEAGGGGTTTAAAAAATATSTITTTTVGISGTGGLGGGLMSSKV